MVQQELLFLRVSNTSRMGSSFSRISCVLLLEFWLFSPDLLFPVLSFSTDIMTRDRSFLKLVRMTMVSDTTGNIVRPKIKKRDDLSTFNIGSNTGSTLVMATGKKPSPTSNGFSTRFSHVRDADQAEGLSTDTLNILNEQRKDIDHILSSVEGVQTQIDNMKSTIESLKANQNPPNLGQAPSKDLNFTRDIELLMENFSDMSSKVHEIDRLNLELKAMKRRVQRLEDGNMSTQSSHTITGLTQDTPRAKLAKMTGSLARRSVPSDRGASHLRCQSDLIDSSIPNDDVELSRNLPAVGNEDKSLQQDPPVMSNNANQNAGPSSSQMQRQSSDQPKLNAGSNTVATVPVSANRVTTFRQWSSIPDTQHASSSTSSSPSHLSPIPARAHPKSTTPESPAIATKALSATSLNSHRVVPVSDSEDDDYDPNSYQHTTPPRFSSRGSNRTRGSGRRHRRSAPIRLPTPEWEKPSWTGPTNITPITTRPLTARGRGILRRGVSGRTSGAEPDPKRRKTTSNDEEMQRDVLPKGHETGPSFLNGGDVERSLSTSKDDEEIPLTRHRLPDTRRTKKARDEQGRLLRPDGRIDRRSLRYRKGANATKIERTAAAEHGSNGLESNIEKLPEVENGDNDMATNIEELPQHKSEKRDRRARDVEGFLLKPDGSRDGRSVRMIRAAISDPEAGEPQAEDSHKKLMRRIMGLRR